MNDTHHKSKVEEMRKTNDLQVRNTSDESSECIQLQQKLNNTQKSELDLKITMMDRMVEKPSNNSYQHRVPMCLTLLVGNEINPDGLHVCDEDEDEAFSQSQGIYESINESQLGPVPSTVPDILNNGRQYAGRQSDVVDGNMQVYATRKPPICHSTILHLTLVIIFFVSIIAGIIGVSVVYIKQRGK